MIEKTSFEERDAYPPETAPKDGTMLRLLVRYTRDPNDDCNPLEDVERDEAAWTIGFFQYGDSIIGRHGSLDVWVDGQRVGEWHIAGWDWEQDCFTTGHGEVIGWLPFAARKFVIT